MGEKRMTTGGVRRERAVRDLGAPLNTLAGEQTDPVEAPLETTV